MRVDGTLHGDLRADDLVEVTTAGVVVGIVRAPQVLVAGQVLGGIEATERVTLLETARVQGRLVSPWLDVRNGARLRADVVVQRD